MKGQQIKKAVIPAAGLGTRMLPASKACPKEMLPIVDKPAIQYIVEEAVEAGIADILIITNRGKDVIEDHFDHSIELEHMLAVRGKTEELKALERVSHLANIYFLRQKETRGLGHAVLAARSFVGDDPFAVLYGDDVIIGKDPAIAQLIRAYETYGKGVAGVNAVSEEDIGRYCSLAVTPLKDRLFQVTDMVEKPAPEQILSLYSILGRCVLPPEIFDILEQTPNGAGGELQLTDAMKTLAQTQSMVAVDFTGIRYDMGSRLGFLQANVEQALRTPELKDQFAQYLQRLFSKMSQIGWNTENFPKI